MKIHSFSIGLIGWLLIMPLAGAQDTLGPGSPDMTAGAGAGAPEYWGNFAIATNVDRNDTLNAVTLGNTPSTNPLLGNTALISLPQDDAITLAAPTQPLTVAPATLVRGNNPLIGRNILGNIASSTPSTEVAAKPASAPRPVNVAPGTAVRGYDAMYAPYTVGNTTSMNFPTGNATSPTASPRPFKVAPGTDVIGNNTLYGNYTVGNTTSTNFPEGRTSSLNFP